MEEGLPLDTSNYGAQSNTSRDAYNVDSVLQSPYSPGLDTVNNSLLEIDLQGEPQGPHSPLLDNNFERNSSLAINLLNQTHSEEPLTNSTGRYLLKIKEENRLTQTATQRVGQATSDLFSATFRRLQRKPTYLRFILCSLGLSLNTVVHHNALPIKLSDSIERVQKQALCIIFPALHYQEALGTSGCVSLHTINQSISQSTLLVHPIKMGFHIPITIKSNMNNRNLK